MGVGPIAQLFGNREMACAWLGALAARQAEMIGASYVSDGAGAVQANMYNNGGAHSGPHAVLVDQQKQRDLVTVSGLVMALFIQQQQEEEGAGAFQQPVPADQLALVRRLLPELRSKPSSRHRRGEGGGRGGCETDIKQFKVKELLMARRGEFALERVAPGSKTKGFTVSGAKEETMWGVVCLLFRCHSNLCGRESARGLPAWGDYAGLEGRLVGIKGD